jgi:hypothetical protein
VAVWGFGVAAFADIIGRLRRCAARVISHNRQNLENLQTGWRARQPF